MQRDQSATLRISHPLRICPHPYLHPSLRPSLYAMHPCMHRAPAPIYQTLESASIVLSSSSLSWPLDTRKSTWLLRGHGSCARAASNSRRASATMARLACGGARRAARMTSRYRRRAAERCRKWRSELMALAGVVSRPRERAARAEGRKEGRKEAPGGRKRSEDTDVIQTTSAVGHVADVGRWRRTVQYCTVCAHVSCGALLLL